MIINDRISTVISNLLDEIVSTSYNMGMSTGVKNSPENDDDYYEDGERTKELMKNIDVLYKRNERLIGFVKYLIGAQDEEVNDGKFL